MAKGRRPPDFRNTLGSIVQSALEQVGAVREVVERGAQVQRHRFDAVKWQRKRRDVLADLGEAVYKLAVRGRLAGLEDEPTIRARLEEVDDIDQRIENAEERARDDGGFSASAGRAERRREAVSSSAQPRRPRPEREVRVWRPVPPFAADAAGAQAQPDARADARADADADEEAETVPVRARPTPVADPAQLAGIRFDDDWDEVEAEDDLEEYMNEEDVPPKSENQ